MKEKRKSTQTEKRQEKIADMPAANMKEKWLIWRQRLGAVWQKIYKKLKSLPYKELVFKVRCRIKNFSVQKINLADTGHKIGGLGRKICAKVNLPQIGEKVRRLSRLVSDFWKTAAICGFIFFFCYYFIGSLIAEKIDVNTQCQVRKTDDKTFETANCLAFLIKREVDDKMWTPNVPLIFPAYVLDNMPNFQMGMISGVKNIVAAVRKFEHNSPLQRKDIQKAYKMLSYSPRVWLMSRQSAFKLAPSSNSQYRKAARELHKYAKDGEFEAVAADFDKLLVKMRVGLLSVVHKNAEHQQEKSAQMFDLAADDVFYFTKGYAFSLWQASKVLALDFKPVILQNDMYTDWTYVVSSLQKAAEFQPSFVRNGQMAAITAPNHLLVQNYYLLRAVVGIDNMRHLLLKEKHND